MRVYLCYLEVTDGVRTSEIAYSVALTKSSTPRTRHRGYPALLNVLKITDVLNSSQVWKSATSANILMSIVTWKVQNSNIFQNRGQIGKLLIYLFWPGLLSIWIIRSFFAYSLHLRASHQVPQTTAPNARYSISLLTPKMFVRTDEFELNSTSCFQYTFKLSETRVKLV